MPLTIFLSYAALHVIRQTSGPGHSISVAAHRVYLGSASAATAP